MLPGRAHLPADASPPEASDEGRPDFIYAPCKSDDRPIPASAIREWAPDPVVRSGRPECSKVYITLSPEASLYARRFAYASITPAPREIADLKAFVRSAVLAAAPDLQPFVLAVDPTMTADMCLRFATVEDREAAVARQPFELDGFKIELARQGEPKDARPSRSEYLVRVDLLNYPKEERAMEDIDSNLSGVGHVIEVDPACFDAPDLAPLRLVLQLDHPRGIPRELRIRYVGWYGSGSVCPREVARSIIPVQIVKVWNRTLSIDADGRYMPVFKPAAAAGEP